jgi:hypothetical protein
MANRTPAGQEHEDMLTALFAQLVMQQANMATMFLGKGPHPESGQTTKDIEAAKLFIDELEMLEVKTRGNLSKDEAALLKQTLMSLRLGFVEAVESAPAASEKPAPAPAAKPSQTSAAPVASSAGEEEHPKKFSKKY